MQNHFGAICSQSMSKLNQTKSPLSCDLSANGDEYIVADMMVEVAIYGTPYPVLSIDRSHRILTLLRGIVSDATGTSLN